jgi:predicted transcriptional regulator
MELEAQQQQQEEPEVVDSKSSSSSSSSNPSSNKFKNRSRMEIVANLLTIAKTGALKTHLMYRANLSYLMVTEYLNYLCRAGLIKESLDEEKATKIYQTTPKGIQYLEAYQSLQTIAGLGQKGVASPNPTSSVLSE